MHTFGGLIRHVLNDPNITIGLFAITNKVAQGFLFQIMQELASNEDLKVLFPDILYDNPKTQAPRWSQQVGIMVKRTAVYKNATIEAHGLVDGNYTGSRFKLKHYDDAINQHTVNTREMIRKAIQGINLSQATYVPGGWSQFVGTFYGHDDPYTHLIREGWPYELEACYEIKWDECVLDDDTGLPRKFVYDETKPIYLDHFNLEKLKRSLGEEFGIQMMCNPNAQLHEGFQLEWIQFYKAHPVDEAVGKTVYILVDPANEKKRGSSYTAMWVVGLGPDHNYYILDGVRTRLDLYERTEALFDLVSRWKPYEVRYEKYGLQSDIQHIELMMERRGYRFIIEPVGGMVKKEDRIRRLVPLFRQRRVFFPEEITQSYVVYKGEVLDPGMNVAQTYESKSENLVQKFISEEYLVFPSSRTNDMMDALARIAEPEMDLSWPTHSFGQEDYAERMLRERQPATGSWMGA